MQTKFEKKKNIGHLLDNSSNKRHHKEYEFKAQSLNKCHLQVRSENERCPKRVGTSAAFGAFPPHIPLDGGAVLEINCFKSFTK